MATTVAEIVPITLGTRWNYGDVDSKNFAGNIKLKLPIKFTVSPIPKVIEPL